MNTQVGYFVSRTRVLDFLSVVPAFSMWCLLRCDAVTLDTTFPVVNQLSHAGATPPTAIRCFYFSPQKNKHKNKAGWVLSASVTTKRKHAVAYNPSASAVPPERGWRFVTFDGDEQAEPDASFPPPTHRKVARRSGVSRRD